MTRSPWVYNASGRKPDMNLGLRSKNVVVTGGSRGIGRAIALAFAEEGANVAICARGEDTLVKTAEELRQKNVKVFARPCDIADPKVLDGFLEETRSALGSVDVLVNNAAAFIPADDENAWQTILNLDLMAAVRAVWKVVPWMKERGGGAIVHISSIAGLEGGWPPSYAVSKAALVSHSK